MPKLNQRKESLKEGLLETARYAVLLLVGWGISYVAGLPETEATLLVAGLLRFIDKTIHELDTVRLKGLLPF